MADKAEEYDIEQVTVSILESCIFNVVHDLVLETHRKEKLLLQTLDPRTNIPLCVSCGLPRLLEPALAISTPDSWTKYCSNVPWSKKAGHDIYGNPFPIQGSEKPLTKREREARAKADREARLQAAAKDNKSPDAAPEDGGGGGGGEQPTVAGGPVDKKSAKVGEKLKSGNYTPWHTCPSCKRSLLITRFAQHLEKCLGIGGRAVRNNNNAASTAAAAAAAAAASTKETPAASVVGTPGSGKEDNDDDEDDTMRKKVLKARLNTKKLGPPPSIKLSLTAGKGHQASGKRDRKSDDDDDDDDDDDEDLTPLRKKQKLIQRSGSAASLLTTDNASVVGDESVDGSFVAQDDDDDGDEASEVDD